MGIARIYRRTSPYPSTAVKEVDYVQTADTQYTAHLDYPPQKLTRYGHTDWRWNALTFGPTISPPVGISTTVSAPNTTGYHGQIYQYIVTKIGGTSPVQESRASTIVGASNDLSLAGNYNTINLPAVGADERHVIYRKMAGTFGYIGNTVDATFRDENLLPILSEAPPEGYDPFPAAGKYPRAVTLHQQRLTFGGTKEVINGIWLTRSADPENMDRSRPLRNDDSLLFALMAQQVNAVDYLLSLDSDLMVFSGDGVWAIGGGEGGALTPGSIVPKRQSSRGSSRMKPLLVDTVIFFGTSRGRSMRALGFSFEIEGYKSDNVSIFAPHLFKTAGLKKAVFQSEPLGVVWALRDDGVLLAFTWEQDQQVWGWAPMEIDGTVDDIEILSEGGFDRLYLIVDRTINGVARRTLERMALPHQGDINEGCHLDCSISMEFDVPTSTITGLWHLEGATVVAVYDGFVERDLVVTNGTIALPVEASLVHVGLPYDGEIETLPSALTSGEGTAHTNRQQIKSATVRVLDTVGISVGVGGAEQHFDQMAPEDGDLVDDGSGAVDFDVPLPGDWKDTSTIIVRQTEPLPAHVVAIFPDIKVSK